MKRGAGPSLSGLWEGDPQDTAPPGQGIGAVTMILGPVGLGVWPRVPPSALTQGAQALATQGPGSLARGQRWPHSGRLVTQTPGARTRCLGRGEPGGLLHGEEAPEGGAAPTWLHWRWQSPWGSRLGGLLMSPRKCLFCPLGGDPRQNQGSPFPRGPWIDGIAWAVCSPQGGVGVCPAGK